MTRLLYGGEIRRAAVIFDENGAYPSTYIGQGSNFGFTGGLMGLLNDDPDLKDAVSLAQDSGYDITFHKEQLSARHPNEARIDIYDENNEIAMSVLTFSTGGGMFEIVNMDGFPVFMDGSKQHIYICCLSEAAQELRTQLNKMSVSLEVCTQKDKTLFSVLEYRGEDEPSLLDLQHCFGVHWIRKAHAILPVMIRYDASPVFTSAKEALLYSEEFHKEAWELAIDYESSVGVVKPDDVWRMAEHTLQIMKRSIDPPNPDSTTQFGFLPYQSLKMNDAIPLTTSVDAGVLNKAAMMAIAVMENNCAHNMIVAAPTAGSSGVIPSAIFSVGEQLQCSESQLLKGLLTAGLVGSFIANQATFGAEVAACQAENGAASAMAAASIVQMLGGTVRQSFMAASLALQNMLGLVCDPVGGLTEIPCISRNVSAVANVALSANIVIWGFDPVIPLDETIISMFHVGKMLPWELRCTCKGGLCTTETGMTIAKRMERERQDATSKTMED
ncbi:MAG: L-serine ammonia-lyase, iron-sulfur-dependent, subunit alpha [Oscillospiraceae bacterium]|jgi:L-serine dehydratase|nr:L-serine ammonia-lyase, iron-sulfur-dependent, subunit alpha [Oscillospiraceae bacterium]